MAPDYQEELVLKTVLLRSVRVYQLGNVDKLLHKMFTDRNRVPECIEIFRQFDGAWRSIVLPSNCIGCNATFGSVAGLDKKSPLSNDKVDCESVNGLSSLALYIIFVAQLAFLPGN